MNNSFVYCWTDADTGKLYVGSHKGTQEDGYICSSKLMMQHYNERPEAFTRQIIAEGVWSDIRKLEEIILTTINAKKDKQFYNQHNGTGNWVLKEHTSETRAKMRKPKSLEHREKLKGNQNAAGVIKSRETIEKSRRANLGRKNTTEGLKNLRNGQIKRYLDPKQKLIQADAARKGWITRKNKLNVI